MCCSQGVNIVVDCVKLFNLVGYFISYLMNSGFKFWCVFDDGGLLGVCGFGGEEGKVCVMKFGS